MNCTRYLKMFGLSYLNVEGTENEKYQASILYKICSEIYMKELFELRAADVIIDTSTNSIEK